MNKLEHIGIAVKDLAVSNKLFTQLLGVKPYKTEEVKSEAVNTSFFKVGDLKIELLEASKPESPITKFIEKKGEGIHHLAFDVSSIEARTKELTKVGFQPLNPLPKKGADNKKVVFFHPKTTNGVLIELCQEDSPKTKTIL